MRLKILTSSTTTYEGTESSTGYTPEKLDYIPDDFRKETPFTEDKWTFPKHWREHQKSADALKETAKELQDSIAELEELKRKVTESG